MVRVKLFFDDEDFDGQLLRAVSYTAYEGADIGECFETAGRIKEATGTAGTRRGPRRPTG